jgi:hypothetical protein
LGAVVMVLGLPSKLAKGLLGDAGTQPAHYMVTTGLIACSEVWAQA